MPSQPYTLQFDPKISLNAAGKHVRDGLSTAFCTGDNLWLSCDERTSVERLRRTGPQQYGKHVSYPLVDILDLPGAEKSEIDIEGLTAANHYLWIVGSHSLKRKQPNLQHEDVARQIARLAKVDTDPNRYLLARIPMLRNEQTGDFELHKTVAHPTKPNKKLRAAQLHGSAGTNDLMKLLAQDPHLKPFAGLPGKDNGFDIEGLAATADGRLFVGLRGPVLRGWAVILELLPKLDKHGCLRLSKIGGEQKYYKKHFLALGGMGLRELRLSGDDLYLLAGPTMSLDGTIAVYCWPDALNQAGDSLIGPDKIRRLFDVPHGHGPTAGQDKAEGMTMLDENHVLIVFDSPADARKPAAHQVLANEFRLPG